MRHWDGCILTERHITRGLSPLSERRSHTVIAGCLVILALLAAACSGNASADPDTIARATAPVNPLSVGNLPVNGDRVELIARVNDREITLPEFEQALARKQQEVNAADTQALAADVLDTLIEQALIDSAAQSLEVNVSDAQLDAEVQTYIEQAGGQDGWQRWLSENNYTQGEFRNTLRDMLVTTSVRDAVIQDIPDSVRQVHARHILVQTEKEAVDVLTRLGAGENFAALAQKLSRDVTSAEQGGDLGWFSRDELLEPVLADVAFSLLPGQIGGPVGTRLGYHVIQTLEFADLPLNDEKRAMLMQTRFENWLQSLLDSATIERFGGF